MQPRDTSSGDMLMDDLRARDRDFATWLNQLRDRDRTFAHASMLQPEKSGEYQAGVYLISGCAEIWSTLGDRVLEDRSLAPIIHELAEPTRGWSSGEQTLLSWAAHFWNIDESEVTFPTGLDDTHFQRWITACHLRQGTAPPAPTPTRGGGPWL